MKKTLFLALLLFSIIGCEKSQDPIEVTLSINIAGFNITTDDFGSLKSVKSEVFSDFQHKYSGGVLDFTAPSGAIYSFNTKGSSVAGFTFSMNTGTYQLKGTAGSGYHAGTSVMPFNIPEQEIVIYDTTTVLNITITPSCALILVADAQNLLESAVLQSSSSADWPFYQDGIYYFEYLAPRDNIYAKLTKKDATTLSMETGLLKVGYIYKIEVTDGAGGIGFNLNGGFEEGETIIW